VFWVALPSPRNSALERLAGSPWLRKVVQRLPAPLREQKLGRMAFVLALNTEGQVVHNLQDPAGSYGPVTSVTEANGRLYLFKPVLQRWRNCRSLLSNPANKATSRYVHRPVVDQPSDAMFGTC
jgi:hypothetical protein